MENSLRTLQDDDQLARLAEDFALRLRAGEEPNLDDYCQQYPDLAELIRETFPTLILLEGLAMEPDDDLPSSSIPSPGAGRTLGDYKLIREIGQGGMGVVFEARQKSLDRLVALKLLRSRFAPPAHVERFKREARASGRLEHENIVPVFEAGEFEGELYLAMQLIRGRSLSQRMNPDAETDRARVTEADITDALPDVSPRIAVTETHAMDATTVATIGVQAADALSFAHENGVLHRDIKPANLLLDESNKLWITDFGLARLDDESMTGTNELLGTLKYMPPERFDGTADARGDIYSLGLTLYELVSGRAAFSGVDRIHLIRQLTQNKPSSLKELCPDCPPVLAAIIERACACQVCDRYQSAAAMRDDLQRFLDCPEKPIATSPRKHKTKKLVAIGVVTMCCVAAFATWQIDWSGAANLTKRDVAEPNARNFQGAVIASAGEHSEPGLPQPKLTITEALETNSSTLKLKIGAHIEFLDSSHLVVGDVSGLKIVNLSGVDVATIATPAVQAMQMSDGGLLTRIHGDVIRWPIQLDHNGATRVGPANILLRRHASDASTHLVTCGSKLICYDEGTTAIAAYDENGENEQRFDVGNRVIGLSSITGSQVLARTAQGSFIVDVDRRTVEQMTDHCKDMIAHPQGDWTAKIRYDSVDIADAHAIGKLTQTLPYTVRSFAVRPDGKLIALQKKRTDVVVFVDTQTWATVGELKLGQCDSLKFSPSGAAILGVAEQDSIVCCLDDVLRAVDTSEPAYPFLARYFALPEQPSPQSAELVPGEIGEVVVSSKAVRSRRREQLAHASQRFPNEITARVDWAVLLAGDPSSYDQAVVVINEVMGSVPNSAATLCGAIEIYTLGKDWREAHDCLLKLERLSDRLVTPFESVVRLHAGEINQALTSAERWQTIVPAGVVVNRHIADVLLASGKIDAAIKVFQASDNSRSIGTWRLIAAATETRYEGAKLEPNIDRLLTPEYAVAMALFGGTELSPKGVRTLTTAPGMSGNPDTFLLNCAEILAHTLIGTPESTARTEELIEAETVRLNGARASSIIAQHHAEIEKAILERLKHRAGLTTVNEPRKVSNPELDRLLPNFVSTRTAILDILNQ